MRQVTQKASYTHSEQETKDFGKILATSLSGGSVLCLYGELGAGKTTLVKGIAEGLGVADDITSPTFALLQLYPLPREHREATHLAHIDTYRLKSEAELIGIGAEDYIGAPQVITVIEWPEKISKLLEAKKVINITLDHRQGNQRTIKIAG